MTLIERLHVVHAVRIAHHDHDRIARDHRIQRRALRRALRDFSRSR